MLFKYLCTTIIKETDMTCTEFEEHMEDILAAADPWLLDKWLQGANALDVILFSDAENHHVSTCSTCRTEFLKRSSDEVSVYRAIHCPDAEELMEFARTDSGADYLKGHIRHCGFCMEDKNFLSETLRSSFIPIQPPQTDAEVHRALTPRYLFLVLVYLSAKISRRRHASNLSSDTVVSSREEMAELIKALHSGQAVILPLNRGNIEIQLAGENIVLTHCSSVEFANRVFSGPGEEVSIPIAELSKFLATDINPTITFNF